MISERNEAGTWEAIRVVRLLPALLFLQLRELAVKFCNSSGKRGLAMFYFWRVLSPAESDDDLMLSEQRIDHPVG
jgi:hypothetical protein